MVDGGTTYAFQKCREDHDAQQQQRIRGPDNQQGLAGRLGGARAGDSDHEVEGDAEAAGTLLKQTADFNELNFNYAFVRNEARADAAAN